jgi:hypothetical protein
MLGVRRHQMLPKTITKTLFELVDKKLISYDKKLDAIIIPSFQKVTDKSISIDQQDAINKISQIISTMINVNKFTITISISSSEKEYRSVPDNLQYEREKLMAFATVKSAEMVSSLQLKLKKMGVSLRNVDVINFANRRLANRIVIWLRLAKVSPN